MPLAGGIDRGKIRGTQILCSVQDATMLDADEERLLLLEEEFREFTLKEAGILLQFTDVCAAKQRVRSLVAETKNRHAPIFTLPVELLVSIVQAIQQAIDHSARVEVVVSHVEIAGRSPVLLPFGLR
jgi:hypothetical protein